MAWDEVAAGIQASGVGPDTAAEMAIDAAKAEQVDDPPVIYRRGKRYRVIREGGRLTGMVPVRPGVYEGWEKLLHVGDVLTCAGSSTTFGDGVPALKWESPDGTWVNDCIFYPYRGGMWAGHFPQRGFFEQVED